MKRLLPVLMVCLAWPAFAHDADVIYAQLEHRESGFSEFVTLTSTTLQLLVPVDADGDQLLTQGDLDAKANAIRIGVWDDMPLSSGGAPCAITSSSARMREGFIALVADFTCPNTGELRQDFKILRVLPTNYRVVLGTQLQGEQGVSLPNAVAPGGSGRLSAQGSFTTLTIPRPAPAGAWDQTRFSLAFDDGVRRGASLLYLAAVWALLAVMKEWRRGLLALGLFSVALIAGSFVDGGAIPPLGVVVVMALAAASLKEAPLFAPPIAALALGSLQAGGGAANALGLALGALVVLLPAGVVAIAVGRMLQRRAAAWRVLKWVGVAGVIGGAALRLSQ
ncbi:MAG: hypothetical protein JNM17_19255 [Archangium sp.]|nr:hypothetical protein [Archangium sp.]